MTRILFAGLVMVLLASSAAAADAPPGAANAPPSSAPAARTAKPTLHDPGRRTRHCTVTHIRMREGKRWVTRTRRSCR